MGLERTRLAIIVGTRPEVIKLSRVIAEADRAFDVVLIHTGQNFDHELNGIFFEELGVRPPDYQLEAVGKSAAETIGEVVIRSHRVLVETKPDALLILGDTNSCLSVISAKRLKIPIFHMEAGNRCFDSSVPEEVNRKIVDHTSDVNLPYGEHARRNLLAEGLPTDRIITTGSPMREVIEHHRAAIENSSVLARLDLESGDYFLVSTHREENVDDPASLSRLLDSIEGLVDSYDLPVIVSTHARTQKRLDALDRTVTDPRIRFLKPLGFFDYVHLQQHARCVLSDSGTITEESALLNVPAVTLRHTHERPEGMDRGTLLMGGIDPESVLEAVSIATLHHSRETRAFEVPEAYSERNVSKKVVRIIASYIDYVHRTVWSRPRVPRAGDL